MNMKSSRIPESHLFIAKVRRALDCDTLDALAADIEAGTLPSSGESFHVVPRPATKGTRRSGPQSRSNSSSWISWRSLRSTQKSQIQI